MKKVITRGLLLAGLVGAFALATPARSDAAFTAYICNDAACAGMDDYVVLDNGLGGDTTAGDGVIVNSGSYFGFTLILNAAASKPSLQTGMDLNYTMINSGGSGTFYLYASDDAFVGPQGLHAHYGGTNDDGGTSQAFVCGGDDNSSVPGALGPCLSSVVNLGGAFANDFASMTATGNPYAMTLGVQVFIPQSHGAASGDLRLIPEPAAMSLFGLGLAAVAAYRRRQQVLG